MNKTDLKAFSIAARLELLARVRERAAFYGITEEKCKSNAVDVSASFQKLDGSLLSTRETQQRFALLSRIRSSGFEQVMEEVAYTWFNRFIALKYMEEHQLLPVDIRVLPEQPGALPQMVKEAQHVELDGISLANVAQMLDENRTDELYKAQLIALCNQLSDSLPQMFEPIEDYTELLFPENLLRTESVLGMMAKLNNPKDANWEDIQVIGWLYQYYISEKHDEVVDINGSSIKKEDIPAATCLYTTDWVVRYMVENSLGALWLEGHDDDNLKQKWRYYMTEGEQPPETTAVLEKIRLESRTVQPENIKVLDPCMGSGHILVYAFDVLMDIYRSVGFTDRDAVECIIQNNLFGLDIDDRAAQLAYFSLMMKACEYDRRFLRRSNQPHVCAIVNSQTIDAENLLCYGELKGKAQDLLESFADAKEYGSIIHVPISLEDLYGLKSKGQEIIAEADNGLRLDEAAINKSAVVAIEALLPQAIILAQHYDAVVTNPPYLNKYSANLKRYIQEEYPDYKSDLFSVFMARNFDFCKSNGYSAFMTPFVWMFIKSYEKLRGMILDEKTITTLIQMEYSAFEEATVPICSFVLRNTKMNYAGNYLRLAEFKGGMDVQNEKVLEAQADPGCKYRYAAQQDNFSIIPGSPIAYWVSQQSFNNFVTMKKLGAYGTGRIGLITGDTSRFIRIWSEVSFDNIGFGITSNEDSILSGLKWFPIQNGGDFRRWYGNIDSVVNWENDGYEMKFDNYAGERVRSHNYNGDYAFQRAISWTTISSAQFCCRYATEGYIFDTAGPFFIPNDYNDIRRILAFLETKIADYYLNVINPTINFPPGYIQSLPFDVGSKGNEIDSITSDCVELSKNDWDSRETSWDFKKHSLI